MKDEKRKQKPLPQEDNTVKIKTCEELDEEYFRTNVPDGFEVDKHQDEYEYIWSCEPQKSTCPIEPQHFTGQFYNKETKELSFHTFIKTTLTNPTTGTTRTYVKYVFSKTFTNEEDK